MKPVQRRSAGILPVAALALGVAAACAPARPWPEPPSLERFSAAGAPARPAARPTPARTSERAPDTEPQDDTRPIYAFTDERGRTHITNTRDDATPPRSKKNATGARLYHWRDANGGEHITDSKPPPGAKLLGTMPE